MRERHLADVKAVVILAAGIYHRNDAEDVEGRTFAECKRDAVASVTGVITGLVDDTRNARPIANAAVVAVYGRQAVHR